MNADLRRTLVLMPAYNEEANVASAVEQVSTVTRQLGIDYEIILVNDGSADRTGEIGRELEQRIPNFRLVEHYPNRGYGGSLKAGFAAATRELMILTSSSGALMMKSNGALLTAVIR